MPDIIYLLGSYFSFSSLSILSKSLLTYKVSSEKSIDSIMREFLYMGFSLLLILSKFSSFFVFLLWNIQEKLMPNFLKFLQKRMGEEIFKLILWGQHHPNAKIMEEKKSNTKTSRKEIYKPINQPQKDKYCMIPPKSSIYNSQIHRIKMWSEDCQGPCWWSNRKLLMNRHDVSVKQEK